MAKGSRGGKSGGDPDSLLAMKEDQAILQASIYTLQNLIGKVDFQMLRLLFKCLQINMQQLIANME